MTPDNPTFEQVATLLATITIEDDGVDQNILKESLIALADYRRSHGRRLWRSLQLVKQHLSSTQSIRILELGAAPYFFTALLHHYLDNCEVTGVNVRAAVWPGEDVQPEQSQVRL